MPLTVVRLHAPFNLLLVLGRIGCVRERFARFVSFVSGKTRVRFRLSSSRVSNLESLERVSCVICHWLLCVPPVPISRIRFPVAPAESHGLRGFKIVHNKDPKIITDIRNYIYVCVKCQMLSEYV